MYQQPYHCLGSKNMAAFVKRGKHTFFSANVFTSELKEGNLQEF